MARTSKKAGGLKSAIRSFGCTAKQPLIDLSANRDRSRGIDLEEIDLEGSPSQTGTRVGTMYHEFASTVITLS